MRSIKILGIAAIAAMLAAAFLASSAVAVPEHPEIVFCKVAELPCLEKNWDPAITEIHLESLAANPPKLLTSIGTVECEKSLMIVTALNKLAVIIWGHLLALSFESCKLGATKCEVKVNELGGSSTSPNETKLLARVILVPFEKRVTNFTVKCGSLINCTYSASEETEMTLHSDAEGHLLLLANETPLELTGGSFCPKASKWDVEYHAVELPTLNLKLGLWIEL